MTNQTERYTVDIEFKDGSFEGYGPSFSTYDEALARAKYVASLKGYDGELINGGAYINAPSGNIYRVSPDGGVQLWHAADGGPGPTENVSGGEHEPENESVDFAEVRDELTLVYEGYTDNRTYVVVARHPRVGEITSAAECPQYAWSQLLETAAYPDW